MLVRTLLILSLFAFTMPLSAEDVEIDTAKSSIRWTGTKVTGSHVGTLAIKEGAIKLDGDKIVGGEFTFDMTSINNEDLTDPVYKKKLEDHLKSDDFFSVSTHPEASFKLNSVVPLPDSPNGYNVEGVLTIKNISHPISFISTITQDNGNHQAKAKLKFDRTKWDVKYNSGKFFSLAALGDKLIYDDIEIELNIVAPAA